MSNIVYYVLDTETTGLKSGYNEISEIGIVRFSDMRQLFTQVKCEHPERANYDALAITKKKLSDLSKGQSKEDAVAWCEKFFAEDGLTSGHRCIVAHNAPFDRKFIHALWASCGKDFPADLWLCSMSLTRKYAKKTGLVKPKVNLHASCDMLQIKKVSEAHNAKVDSQNTFFLWKRLKDDGVVDYLPDIKNFPHNVKPVLPGDDDGLDVDMNDFIEQE